MRSRGERPGLGSETKRLKDTRYGFNRFYVQSNSLAPFLQIRWKAFCKGRFYCFVLFFKIVRSGFVTIQIEGELTANAPIFYKAKIVKCDSINMMAGETVTNLQRVDCFQECRDATSP